MLHTITQHKPNSYHITYKTLPHVIVVESLLWWSILIVYKFYKINDLSWQANFSSYNIIFRTLKDSQK